ncbi:MAG: sensor histidine kinase, partial [Selenomonas sp.]|nr:sensor histidine kinase [Selenomonas sp.]
VEVEGELSGHDWQLKVKDHGPGIPPEDLPHIFDRFKKGGQDNAQGTGLGLAIAREIALRHGIELTCESRQGEGASFIIKGKTA